MSHNRGCRGRFPGARGSGLVAVVISSATNPFYAVALELFTAALQKTGPQVLLIHVASDHSLDGVLPRLASYRVDAIVSALPVLSEAVAQAFASIRIPTVSFNTPIKNHWVTSVCTDSAGGGRAIAELFVARGQRHSPLSASRRAAMPVGNACAATGT